MGPILTLTRRTNDLSVLGPFGRHQLVVVMDHHTGGFAPSAGGALLRVHPHPTGYAYGMARTTLGTDPAFRAQLRTDECLDCLLENGVIVPPCKVGDTVYYIGGIHRSLIKSATVVEIIVNSTGVSDLFVKGEDGVSFENSLDTFFFTREEAELALNG